MQWKANWIWDTSGPHPRNYWACFRRSFELRDGESGSFDDVILSISADSRYVAYVNGKRIGFGPVRSWPFLQSYDTYSIKDYLEDGKNVIAVLVTHYGISTFQYIEGRGGLIAQVDFHRGGRVVDSIITDGTWKNKVHSGYRQASVRISCQQAWAEIYDARAFDEGWNEVDFDDSDWANSIVVGPCGIEPWKKLVERDIPYLTEELIYPRRVLSRKEVIPVRQQVSLDLRPNFYPGQYDANPKRHLGYLATVIRSPKAMRGKIIFPFGRWISTYGDFRIGDKVYKVEGSVEVELAQGDNLFLMNVSGGYHDFFTYMAFDFEEQLEFRAPVAGGEHEFITIGPFDAKDMLSIGYPHDDSLKEPPEYKEVWNVTDASGLSHYAKWIKPVLREHTCQDNVYTVSTVKKDVRELDVPYDLQNMVIANGNYATIAPAPCGDTELIIDFGRELSGFIEFDVDAPEGAILDFYLFEAMEDGKIQHTNGLNNTLRYFAKQGRQTYRSVVRRGFRFMMLTVRNLRSPLKIYSVRAYLSSFPAAEVGEFRCSDYLLNRIWEISRDTTRLCMEDTFVDCPAYEQTFWVGDSRNEALINYYTFGAYAISRRCLLLVPKSMYRSVLPESQVPSGWQNILTAWTLLWMRACKEYYEITGEMEFVSEIYPSLMETARNFERFIDKRGLLSIVAWNMLDWAPMDTPGSGVVTHQNALLVKALRDTAYLAEVLGRREDTDYLLGFAERVKGAINEYLWSDEKRAYIDSIHADGKPSPVVSLQTNAVVYLCDCAEGDRKALIEGYLLNPPEGFVKIGSPFMSFFYFEALMKLGRLGDVLDNIRENWGYMLDHGATTCWETFGHTRSHCHAWSAAPGYFLGSYVLGVRPLEPGFKKVLIQPDLCGLAWARGSVPTPNGRIDVALREGEDFLDVRVRVPAGTVAEVVLPQIPGKEIRFDGKDTAGKAIGWKAHRVDEGSSS